MSNYAPALNQCEVSDDGILSSFDALGFSLASIPGTLLCCRDSTLTLELGLLPSARGKTSALRALARLRATHLSNIQQPIRGQLQCELRRGRLSVRSFFFFSFSSLKLMQNFSKETRDQHHADAYMNK